MKLRHIRKIDYWVGIPLCILISFWEFLLGKRLASRQSPPRKVLFIELSEMGSAVLSYSALYQAQKQFENAERFFLIFESNVESVELLGVIPPQNILTIRNKNFFEFTVTALAALRRIRALRIDTIIDMELFSRFTAIFSYVTGAPNRVGFHQYTGEGLFRGGFMTHRVLYNPHQHIALNFLNLIFALKAPHNEVPLLKESLADKLVPLPSYEVTSKEKTDVFELLRRKNRTITPQSSLVIINAYPGELLPIRGWPIGRYGDLVKRLLDQDQGLYIALTGLSTAANCNEQIASRVKNDRCIDLAGQTGSLRDFVNLLSVARVLVTTDSGPAHFAPLVGVHSVVLFGPETPALYSPIGRATTALYSNFSCSPCISAFNHRNTPCSDNKCLQAISVEQVYSAVIAAYRTTASHQLKVD